MATIILALYQHVAVVAQDFKHWARKYQFGFEGSLGVKSFRIISDIEKINQLNVIEEGGTIGVVAGTQVFRFRLRQGFFYSSSSVAQTVDELRSALGANIYPLELIKRNTRLAPYITTGVERNIFRMYGFYGGENTNQTRNYSVSEAPFLGKISAMQASVGIGLEYRMKAPGHFVNFFGETRFVKNLTTNSSTPIFNYTTVSDQVTINLGISYGYSK